MSIDTEGLRTLHRLHVQLSDLKGRLRRGPKQVANGQARVAKLKEEHQAAKELHKRTQMTVHAKELSLKEREGKIVDVQTRLNSCSSNKEYQAYMEQMEADRAANEVLESEIIEWLDKVTEQEAAIEVANGLVAECEAELKKIEAHVEGVRSQLESEIARIEAELIEAETILPGDIRSEYDRVVNKHAEEALAPIDEDCCGGCFQKITPQMLNELLMSRAVFCKSCGRLLYLPEDSSVS